MNSTHRAIEAEAVLARVNLVDAETWNEWRANDKEEARLYAQLSPRMQSALNRLEVINGRTSP